MALKTTTVSITDPDSRDNHKVYKLTEMPASKAEKFAVRAFLALARGGVEIPENIKDAGMAGLATVGFSMLSKVEFVDAELLMDEMMTCVTFIPNTQSPDFSRNLVESDIEEIKTRVRLRAEVFALHTGFSWADAASRLNSMIPAPASQDTKTSPAS